MNGEYRSESWTAELSDDIDDPRVIGRLPDEPTQVRRVKLPVAAGCGLDLSVQLPLPWVSRLLRSWRFRWSAYRTG